MALKFLKKGAEAQKAFDKAEATANAAASASKMSDEERAYRYRFWMPAEAEAMITFLDGDLNENGILEEVSYYEHQVQIGNDWRNFFPCVAEQEPCPLCTADNKNSFISVFTIIDHGEWTDKQGVVHKNEKKLYACKRETLKLLRKIAIKRGGLRGCTFDVGRTGDRAPNVGSSFDFLKKWDMAEFKSEYHVQDVKPLDYEKVIKYRSAKELKELGLGASMTTIGNESGADLDLSKDL